MTVVSIQRTCKPCGAVYTITPAQDRAGHGRQCKACTAKAPRYRPPSAGPSSWQWPISDGGGTVVCARCQRTRNRGERCQCERREP